MVSGIVAHLHLAVFYVLLIAVTSELFKQVNTYMYLPTLAHVSHKPLL